MEQGTLVEGSGSEAVESVIRRAEILVVPARDRDLLWCRVEGAGGGIRSWAVYREPAAPASLEGFRYAGEDVGEPERGPIRIRVDEDRGDFVHAIIETGQEVWTGPAVRVDARFRVRVRRRATRISMTARYLAELVCFLGSGAALMYLRLAGTVGDFFCILSMLGIVAAFGTAGILFSRCPVCGRNTRYDGAWHSLPPSICFKCGVPV